MQVSMTRKTCKNPECQKAFWTDDEYDICSSCMPETEYIYPQAYDEVKVMMSLGMTFSAALESLKLHLAPQNGHSAHNGH